MWSKVCLAWRNVFIGIIINFYYLSFRWQSGGMDTQKNVETWKGVLNSRLWLLAQDDDQLYYKSLTSTEKPSDKEFNEESVLKDYFQLGTIYILRKNLKGAGGGRKLQFIINSINIFSVVKRSWKRL